MANIKTLKITFLSVVYFFFPFYFCYQVLQSIVPDRWDARCVCAGDTACLQPLPTEFLPQPSQCPAAQEPYSAFPLLSLQPRTSLCSTSASSPIHPRCFISPVSLAAIAGRAPKAGPFSHLLPQLQEEEGLSYSYWCHWYLKGAIL